MPSKKECLLLTITTNIQVDHFSPEILDVHTFSVRYKSNNMALNRAGKIETTFDPPKSMLICGKDTEANIGRNCSLVGQKITSGADIKPKPIYQIKIKLTTQNKISPKQHGQSAAPCKAPEALTILLREEMKLEGKVILSIGLLGVTIFILVRDKNPH